MSEFSVFSFQLSKAFAFCSSGEGPSSRIWARCVPGLEGMCWAKTGDAANSWSLINACSSQWHQKAGPRGRDTEDRVQALQPSHRNGLEDTGSHSLD